MSKRKRPLPNEKRKKRKVGHLGELPDEASVWKTLMGKMNQRERQRYLLYRKTMLTRENVMSVLQKLEKELRGRSKLQSSGKLAIKFAQNNDVVQKLLSKLLKLFVALLIEKTKESVDSTGGLSADELEIGHGKLKKAGLLY